MASRPASAVSAIYVFTDWRMWINIYDVAETSGFSVRSMIVWDKGSPALGNGWRTQHELVLFGTKIPLVFDRYADAQGNVIAAKRTGNLLHPTQKPVELLIAILTVMKMAGIIYDPFGGAGTTMIACEQMDRSAYIAELAPAYVDVAVKRWQAFTGNAATLDGDGRSFDEVGNAGRR
jgi:DNA modification methylase